jgi:phosphoribosylformylglycinamidine synthase
MASKSKVMHEVIKHAEKGGYLFGICNGFQILTETNLLPGALLRNNKLKFICKDVFVKTVNNRIPFTKKIPDQKVLSIPIAHNEGNYFANEDQIKELQDNQQIVFQYCDKQGNIGLANNPNGSLLNIAGITNKHKNILGMMPHPERVIDTLLGGIDGEGIFQSLL